MTLNLVETPLSDVLSQILGSRLGYDVIGKQIVLKELYSESELYAESDDETEIVAPVSGAP